MTIEADFEIRAMCQDANRIAARLRGKQYPKPEAPRTISTLKGERTAKRCIAPMKRQFPITDVQLRVLEFLRRFLAENDQIPPYWAIAKEFGWTSQTSGQTVMQSLARKGLIERNAIGNWRLTREEAAA